MFYTWCDVLHRKSSLDYQVPLGTSILLSSLSCVCERSVSVFLSPVHVRLGEKFHGSFPWPLRAKVSPCRSAFLDTEPCSLLVWVGCGKREKFKKITLKQCPEGSLGGEVPVSGPPGEQDKSALARWVLTLALATVHLTAHSVRSHSDSESLLKRPVL